LNPAAKAAGVKGLKKRENKMKRFFVTLVVFFAIAASHAQEKGLHLILGGEFGRTNFIYELKGGEYKHRMGYGGYLGAQYFFNRHWGISLAGEFFQFNTQSLYNRDQLFMFDDEIDDEGHPCELTIGLLDFWKENQTTNFIEIPLMLMYQHKFGWTEQHGFYFGFGLKAQIPITNSFKSIDGTVSVEGYYPKWDLTLGSDPVQIPWHALGKNPDRVWNGSHNLRTGLAVVGEAGFLVGLSRRVDLTLGVSFDYGFFNINKRNDNLLGPKEGTQQDGSYVGEMVYYNGILNSNKVDNINTMSVRGKLGLRIKIGKLRDREEEPQSISQRRGGEYMGSDTIYVYPVIVYLPPQIPEQDYDGTGGGYPAGGGYPGGGSYPAGGGGGGMPYNQGGSYYNPNARPLPQQVIDSLTEPIYFDLDKSFLRSKSREVLDRKVSLMKRNPQAVLSVVGHTCNLGSEGHNNKLSYDRAEQARLYLIEKGIHPSRIIPIPRGMSNPTYPNVSEHNRELNRRVDFYLAY